MKETSGATITAKELKELRRVFDELCFFSDKAPKKHRIDEISHTLSGMKRLQIEFSSSSAKNEEEVKHQIDLLEQEKATLEEELNEINCRTEQCIRPQDAGVAMKSLGKRMKKREIDEIIWEIDEKIDGVIDWEEFNLMFERNVRPIGIYPSSPACCPSRARGRGPCYT